MARCAAISDFFGRGSRRIAWSRAIPAAPTFSLSPLAKQRHIMPECHQGFGDVENDPLRSAVKFRRHGFIKRRDMGDAHRIPQLFDASKCVSSEIVPAQLVADGGRAPFWEVHQATFATV